MEQWKYIYINFGPNQEVEMQVHPFEWKAACPFIWGTTLNGALQ